MEVGGDLILRDGARFRDVDLIGAKIGDLTGYDRIGIHCHKLYEDDQHIAFMDMDPD